MSPGRQVATHDSYTANVIRRMAERNNVTAIASESDLFAQHVTRLAGDDVVLDDIEQMVVALQRAGFLSRTQAVRLQARYLREARP